MEELIRVLIHHGRSFIDEEMYKYEGEVLVLNCDPDK